MKPIELISKSISRSRTLSNQKCYLIKGEIHVKSGVRLIVQDKTQIWIANGFNKSGILKRSALIFDRGSKLCGKRMTFKAANSLSLKAEKKADNGGLWFIGSYKDAQKDLIRSKVKHDYKKSLFTASQINAYYLGCSDSPASKSIRKTALIGDDLDAISVMGVSQNEWAISSVRSFYSGDDGFDVTNSDIAIKSLSVIAPTEDGMNLSSSRVAIHQKLEILVKQDQRTDRDLFDFETDDGASYLELHKGITLHLEGVFGDQLNLCSSQMRKPNLKNNNNQAYCYSGKLRKSALIFSIDED